MMDVLDSVLAHARATPHQPAAKDDCQDLSYADLRDHAAALATGLVARGVAPGDRVALQLPNSVDFLVGALACMWTGAIFVPLGATDPPARIAGIVADCEPSVVLTNETITSPHPGAVPITNVAAPDKPPVDRVAPDDAPAYAIYTSGTTGAPKGVVIGRRAFATAVWSTIDLLGFDRNTRGMCVSPFHFDGSFGTLFTTVAAGGSLLIPPRESLLFPRYFFRTIERERITLTGFSPSYLRLLLANPQLPALGESTLRILALGGEAMSATDVARLWAVAPDLRVFNRYGPTETTIAVSHFEVTREIIERGGAVPIGIPHPGSTFYLVDEHDRLIGESGRRGELYVGGTQLMAGYWAAPELTGQVMRDDIVAGQTLYRTGDLAVRDPDGNYVFVDRADRVVKRNAVRISLVELGEVLQGLAGVSAATCLTFSNNGDLGIAAFVVASEPRSPAQLRRAAEERLPVSMLPDTIEIVDHLPLTTSSKVDERKLLADAGLHTG